MSNSWQSDNDKQPSQPDWARWEAEHGGTSFDLPPFEAPAPAPSGPSAPVDLETARHLLWAVAALGLLGLLMTLFVVNGEKTAFAQQLVDDVAAQDPSLPITVDTAESYLTGAMVVLVLLGAGFAALFVYWVKKMRLGRMWARTVLTMISTATVVLAVPQLFGFGIDGGGLQVVMAAATILQGVLAGGAIYLMHRKESNAYFLASRKN